MSFQFKKRRLSSSPFKLKWQQKMLADIWYLVFSKQLMQWKEHIFLCLPGTVWISNQIMQNWIEVTLMGASWVWIGNSYHKCVIIFILIIVIVIIVVIIVVVIVVIGSIYNIDNDLSTDLKLSNLNQWQLS